MFKTRVVSGIILSIISILAILSGGMLLAGTLLIISVIAYKELTYVLQVNGKNRIDALEVIGVIGIVCYYICIFFQQSHVLDMLCIVSVFMAEMFVYVLKFPKYRPEQVTSAIFSFIYAPIMLSFIYQIREQQYGMYLVWLIFICSWVCDTCAYAVGMLVGKKKIFPILSPKKSLEGCIGGVAGAAIVGSLYAYFLVDKVINESGALWIIILICIVGSVISMLGDLAASAIKRNHNIKDYGNIIPGHGGIMDRFDSVLMTAPVVYFVTTLLI